MLRKSLSPQDKSQQMIFNNYQTIRFITQNIHTPLSSELLQQIHVLMTEKTLENPADAGAYRTNDEVVVEDAITHEVVHTPPHTKISLHLLKIYAYSSMKVILKYLFTQ